MPNISPGPLRFVEMWLENGKNIRLWSDNIHFVSIDGVGMAPVRRITERSPLQHGETDRGFRLDPRRMTMTLLIEGEDVEQSDALRDRLAAALGPTDNPLQLRITRDDMEVRQIDCYIDGEMDFPTTERIGVAQKVVVPLLAVDPTFYYPTQQSTTAALITGTTNVDITVTGYTFEDWPIIEVTGPVNSGLSITQSPASNQINMTAAIPAGETWVFDLRPNFKIVYRSSDGANRMGYVTQDNLIAFSRMRIFAQKQMEALDTSWLNAYTRFAFVAAGTTGASSVTIRWYRRYISL